MQQSAMTRTDHSMPVHPAAQTADRPARAAATTRRRTRSHGYHGSYAGTHSARYRLSRFRVR